MNTRQELFEIAESCIGPPPESVVIATEDTSKNHYTFYKDVEEKIWYTSDQTEKFNKQMEAAKERLKEKRRTSDAALQEAPEEPVRLEPNLSIA